VFLCHVLWASLVCFCAMFFEFLCHVLWVLGVFVIRQLGFGRSSLVCFCVFHLFMASCGVAWNLGAVRDQIWSASVCLNPKQKLASLDHLEFLLISHIVFLCVFHQLILYIPLSIWRIGHLQQQNNDLEFLENICSIWSQPWASRDADAAN
jgi:hypothetical protein